MCAEARKFLILHVVSVSVFLDETLPVLRAGVGAGVGIGGREWVAGTGGGKKQGLPKITQNNTWKGVADTGSNQASAVFFSRGHYYGSTLLCATPDLKDT